MERVEGVERPMPLSPRGVRCMNHGYNNMGYEHWAGLGESRFNYRDHLPKWANRTLASFYN